MCLLALAPLFTVGAVWAQTPTTLVSSIGSELRTRAFSEADFAHGFTTGSNTSSYDSFTLTSVDVRFASAPGSDLRVRVVEGSSPTGATLATLTHPSSLGSGIQTFAAPAGTTLAAGTEYMVVLDSTTTGGVRTARAFYQDPGAAAGWSVAGNIRETRLIDGIKNAGGWGTEAWGLSFRVNGYANYVGPRFSGATLFDDYKIRVNFDKPIRTGSCPGRSAWTITYNGYSAWPLNRPTCDSQSVTLTSRNHNQLPVTLSDRQVTVTYHPQPQGTRIRAADGAEVPRFSDRPVTNEYPLVSHGTARGNELKIHYDQALDENSVPPGSAFIVVARGPGSQFLNLSAVDTSVSDSTVVLTLNEEIPAGWHVNVRYTVPATNPIQNPAGHDARAFDANGHDLDVTVLDPGGAPRFRSATVAEKTLTAAFTGRLAADSVPAPDAFHVTVNAARRNVASGGVAISGKAVKLTLVSAVRRGDTVKVRYTKPSAGPLRGAAYGEAVETFADQAVTNDTLGTIWSATLTVGGESNGANLGCGSRPGVDPGSCSTRLDNDSFTHQGATYRVDKVLSDRAPTGRVFWISLNRAIPRDWTLHVGDRRFPIAEASLSNGGKDAAWNTDVGWGGNQKVSLSLTGSGGSGGPRLQGAAVDGNTLTATFSLNLDTGSVPAPGAFHVTVNGARRNVASGGVAISGKTVTLTLASAVVSGDTVKVRYTRPSAGPLRSAASGAAVATFLDWSVTNNTPWSATLTVRESAATLLGCTTNDPARCSDSSILTGDSFNREGTSYRVVSILLFTLRTCARITPCNRL